MVKTRSDTIIPGHLPGINSNVVDAMNRAANVKRFEYDLGRTGSNFQVLSQEQEMLILPKSKPPTSSHCRGELNHGQKSRVVERQIVAHTSIDSAGPIQGSQKPLTILVMCRLRFADDMACLNERNRIKHISVFCNFSLNPLPQPLRRNGPEGPDM